MGDKSQLEEVTRVCSWACAVCRHHRAEFSVSAHSPPGSGLKMRQPHQFIRACESFCCRGHQKSGPCQLFTLAQQSGLSREMELVSLGISNYIIVCCFIACQTLLPCSQSLDAIVGLGGYQNAHTCIRLLRGGQGLAQMDSLTW